KPVVRGVAGAAPPLLTPPVAASKLCSAASAPPAELVPPTPVKTSGVPGFTGLPGDKGASRTSAWPIVVSVFVVGDAFSKTCNVTVNGPGGTVEPDSSGKVCVSVTV